MQSCVGGREGIVSKEAEPAGPRKQALADRDQERDGGSSGGERKQKSRREGQAES